MSSKITLSKPREVHSLFPAWLMVTSAVVSVVLFVIWAATKPGLGLAMNTWPLYFPEAPLWHIGLYAAAFITLSYSTIGFVGMRAERILAVFHRGLDLVLKDRPNQSERSE